LFFVNSQSEKKNNIITTNIEHPSILEVCKMLGGLGAEINYIPVDKEGFVNPLNIEKAITDKTLLVSIIHGNNEIGSLQDIEKIGKICREKGVYFHIDACQSFTKTEIDVKKQNIDLMTLNSHKIHGPKGVGALFIRKGVKIAPFFNGGGHEKGMRSGTENVSGIVGFGEAVRLADKEKKGIDKMQRLRDYAIKIMLKIPNTKLNGPQINKDKRLCNNINLSFKNIEGEAISQLLEEEGIYVSTGSACASHSLKRSHVLEAIGLNDLEINSSIRISLSKYTTKKEIDYFIKNLKEIVEKLREISPIK